MATRLLSYTCRTSLGAAPSQEGGGRGWPARLIQDYVITQCIYAKFICCRHHKNHQIYID